MIAEGDDVTIIGFSMSVHRILNALPEIKNLNIKADGVNEHHKIEAIFKAFARAIKSAIKRDPEKMILPSTKGRL